MSAQTYIYLGIAGIVVSTVLFIIFQLVIQLKKNQIRKKFHTEN